MKFVNGILGKIAKNYEKERGSTMVKGRE